ncbi:MAG: carbohydrate binding family 9 domain-containing protein [Rhodothermales bacterium]|nr:carbohydrate binding family 9 domain-containing protein [Rhodothermales bacterium]MBO6779461.1 carbohydrate binding family 9 domain-containing protein [Rhodothermales bacterium]
MIRSTGTVLLIAALALPAAGQDAVVLSRMQAPQLDGVIDADEWQAVTPFPVVQYQPEFMAEPSERTEIRVGYDEEYLYVGAALFDSDPGGIRANTLYRDRYSGDDTFGLVLDTFNDNENALWFFTTPNGVRTDMAVANDAEGGPGGRGGFGSMNTSWNTYWDVATTRDETGWFAEMRIPYSSLGFLDEGGIVRMGLITYRFIARKNERHIFPAIDPAFRMGFAKPSQAQTVILEDVQSRTPVYITPYVTAGAGRASVLNAPGTAYDFQNDYTREIGLDMKQSLGSNLTLDLTVNTDFAQVEADDQQVNLTRFSLFFPEKRQFFQERAGIFEFSTGSQDRLFHTRSIGLSRFGPVRLLGGGRLVGRIGGWDVGLIEMQTARETFQVDGEPVTVPSENFGVLRLRRRVLNDYSSTGGILTSRIDENGGYNVTYGLDGTLRWHGDDYATLQFAQTLAEGVDFRFADAALARIWLERRRQEGFTYVGGITYGGGTYDPGVGFYTRTNYYSPRAGVGYGWFPQGDSPVRRVSTFAVYRPYYRREDHSIESRVIQTRNSLELKSGHNLSLSGSWELEDLRRGLAFPEDTEVPAGRYEFVTGSLSARLPPGGFVRGNAELGYGTFFDGTRLEASLSPSINPSKHLELEATYEYNKVDFGPRDQSFDVHLARLRAQVGFNTKLSINGFVQLNSSADLVTTNARFRYNMREGNDLWVVYNEGLNLDRERLAPFLPISGGRTLLVKYTYTFIR